MPCSHSYYVVGVQYFYRDDDRHHLIGRLTYETRFAYFIRKLKFANIIYFESIFFEILVYVTSKDSRHRLSTNNILLKPFFEENFNSELDFQSLLFYSKFRFMKFAIVKIYVNRYQILFLSLICDI